MPTLAPFTAPFPLIGVVHLLPLPGSPAWGGSLERVLTAAYRDAEAYVAGGFDGCIVENYGDRPFAPGAVGPATVAALTAVAARLRDRFPDFPLGINVLRNDAQAALAVAKAVGASFVRVNVLVGAMITDQGVIEGRAWDLALLRRQLAAEDVALWADVMVKHAAPLGDQTLEGQADDAFKRAGATALVLSGRATGAEADAADFRRVRGAVPAAPLVVGSGLTISNLERFAAVADSAIAATALYGEDERISAQKVREFAAARANCVRANA
ncbi:MAG: BtpA/SgcQ family protein [Candidatus Sericytochromatia bacterium]|nr:BtpA/SgcQ family protein [Candidatus Tanganyikabacteria bacterium]